MSDEQARTIPDAQLTLAEMRRVFGVCDATLLNWTKTKLADCSTLGPPRFSATGVAAVLRGDLENVEERLRKLETLSVERARDKPLEKATVIRRAVRREVERRARLTAERELRRLARASAPYRPKAVAPVYVMFDPIKGDWPVRDLSKIADVNLSVEEVRLILGVSAKTVYNWKQQGKFQSVGASAPVEYGAREIARFLSSVAANLERRIEKVEQIATLKESLERRRQEVEAFEKKVSQTGKALRVQGKLSPKRPK